MRIFILLFTLALSISAQQPKNVAEYFLALPDTFYAPYAAAEAEVSQEDIRKYRRSIIRIEDKPNGYLRLEGAWEGWGEFALFKRADGSYLIAHTLVECGPGCIGVMYFHEYNDGKWNDVTSSVFEAPDDDEVKAAMKRAKADEDANSFFYSLPRKGTEITFNCSMCRNGGDQTLLRYAWKSPKFVRR